MPTAWETLKNEMIKNARPGSFGELREIERAARAFVAILPFLKDRENEEAIFNADESVKTAILAVKQMKDLGF